MKTEAYIDLPALPSIKDTDQIIRTRRSYPEHGIQEDDYLIVRDQAPEAGEFVIIDPDGGGNTIQRWAPGDEGQVRGVIVSLVRTLA